MRNKKLEETLEQNDLSEIKDVAYIDGFNRKIKNDGISATINTGVSFRNQDFIAIKDETIRLGGLFDNDKGTHQAGSIYSQDGTAPALDTAAGGYRTPLIPIKTANKKGYIEATEGDGIDISGRMEYHRGTVQKGMAQTLSCRGGENVGVVVTPSIPSEKNLKQELCNKLISDGIVKEGDVIRHNYTTSKDMDCVQSNNEAPTLDTRCDCLGVVVKGNYSPSNHNASRIVDQEGLAPTVMENHGTITGVEVHPNYIEWNEEGHFKVDTRAWFEDGVSPTTTTTPKQKILQNDLRIRKLTPTECFRLMGVKDEDSKKIKQSDASKYHLAGDSIVTTCLMALFGELLDIDYKQKTNELVEEIKNEL